MRNHTATFNKTLRSEKLVESPHGYPLSVISEAYHVYPHKAKVLFSDHTKTTLKITLSPTQWANCWLTLAERIGKDFCLVETTLEAFNNAYNNRHGEVFLDCEDRQIRAYYLEENHTQLQMIQKGYIPLPFHPVYGDLWIACPEIAKLPK